MEMTDKSNHVEVEWIRGPASSDPMLVRFAKLIYNPEEKSFLGRTPKRWGIVFAFYLIFYAVLALMFALCMGGLFLSLDQNKPKYTLEYSLIGLNPGVTARPRPMNGVVRYSLSNETHYNTYREELDNFFIRYKSDQRYSLAKECFADDNYGFPDTPCFFIKLNRIYGWTPQYYSNVNELPADMPQELADYIGTLDAAQLNQIWLTCWEERPNGTKIEFPWGRGLPATSYPFVNSKGYSSPILAVRFTPPVNELVSVRCRLWAKNIMYNKSLKDASGYVLIQLYIEDDTNSSSAEALK